MREGIGQTEYLGFEVVKCHAANLKTRPVKHTEPSRKASCSAANNTEQALPLNKLRFLCRMIRVMLRQMPTLVLIQVLRKCLLRFHVASDVSLDLPRLPPTDLLHSVHRQCATAVLPCAESEADYMSPVVASISCSPHPAALHIAPAARLRGFCLYDFARGELFLANRKKNLHEGAGVRGFKSRGAVE